MLLSACCWLCSCLACCCPRPSRGPRTRVAFFLGLTHCSLAVGSLIALTTGSLAVVLSLLPPASRCGSLRFRGSLLSPPTPLRSIGPLRDCCFAVDALAPRIGSLQERVLLTMRIGFSFARYFFLTCSAAMSVSLFTGCAHPHKVRFSSRPRTLGTTIAHQMSSLASLCRLVYIHSHCGQLRSFFLCCCVSCTAVRASPHF